MAGEVVEEVSSRYGGDTFSRHEDPTTPARLNPHRHRMSCPPCLLPTASTAYSYGEVRPPKPSSMRGKVHTVKG